MHIEMYTRYRRVREKAIGGSLKKVCDVESEARLRKEEGRELVLVSKIWQCWYRELHNPFMFQKNLATTLMGKCEDLSSIPRINIKK